MIGRGPGIKTVLAGALLLIASSCGYHVGGKADTMPKSIQTVAVLPFRNLSSRYRFADKLQEALSRELMARTRFQVVRDAEHADAVINGAINNVYTVPVIFDPATGKTTTVSLGATLQLSMSDTHTGKVLFNRPPFTVQNNYQISIYPNQYFDESDFALDRVSSDIAKIVVSAIVDNF